MSMKSTLYSLAITAASLGFFAGYTKGKLGHLDWGQTLFLIILGSLTIIVIERHY